MFTHNMRRPWNALTLAAATSLRSDTSARALQMAAALARGDNVRQRFAYDTDPMATLKAMARQPVTARQPVIQPVTGAVEPVPPSSSSVSPAQVI
jgi:hypothetical protein